jgi:hypothetical protein
MSPDARKYHGIVNVCGLVAKVKVDRAVWLEMLMDNLLMG